METQVKSLDLEAIYKNYVGRVKSLSYVHEVLIAEDDGSPTFWTIVDTSPFDECLLVPVYQALFDTMGTVTLPFDFRVLNRSEYPENKNFVGIIPGNARAIWRRT